MQALAAGNLKHIRHSLHFADMVSFARNTAANMCPLAGVLIKGKMKTTTTCPAVRSQSIQDPCGCIPKVHYSCRCLCSWIPTERETSDFVMLLVNHCGCKQISGERAITRLEALGLPGASRFRIWLDYWCIELPLGRARHCRSNMEHPFL